MRTRVVDQRHLMKEEPLVPTLQDLKANFSTTTRKQEYSYTSEAS
jgi:hypothetical protein